MRENIKQKPLDILDEGEYDGEAHDRCISMIESNKIIEFKKELDYDDIKCVNNPLLACDLKQILMITPHDRRLNVALAFSNISLMELFRESGLYDDNKYIYRWTKHEVRLPLGAAFRLAKVFGVPSEILFASPLWWKKKEDE